MIVKELKRIGQGEFILWHDFLSSLLNKTYALHRSTLLTSNAVSFVNLVGLTYQ